MKRNYPDKSWLLGSGTPAPFSRNLMTQFKPMLSARVEDVTTLRWPLLASPKLDGIRAMVIGGVLVSRNLKPIPNLYTQKLFGRWELEGLDGELIVYGPTAPDVFRATTSGVMSVGGEPDVTFRVFDCMSDPELPFRNRLILAQDLAEGRRGIVLVDHTLLHSHKELVAYEANALAHGYEGVMLRDSEAPYKFGRGTVKAQDLMKLKRFADAEAEIIGFEEQMHNSNEAKRDKLGRVERSNHKAGMVGKDTLGALRVRGINGDYAGVEFSVGSGFDDSLRRKIWATQQRNLGKTVKFKYFPSGSKDAPRFPVFLGFREDL